MTMQEQRDAMLAQFLATPEGRVETPDSTAIESYEYDPVGQTLSLKWVGGHEYLYYGIPEYIRSALDETAPSGGQGAGEIANGYVKAGFFPWTRLS